MMTGKLPFPGETVQESMIARLTDEPKTLSEMKADVSWPAAVQLVMDKALQRDADLRYASASEFGRDLYKAVSSMPESAATSAFTAVMHRMSTPSKPTPVVPETPMGASATRAIPQTRVNRATGSSGQAPASASAKFDMPKSRRKGLTGAGIFAGIALLGGLSFKLIGGPESRAADTSSSAGTVGQTTSATQPAGAPATAPVDLPAAFARLDTLTDVRVGANVETARSAQAVLDTLAPHATTVGEKAKVQFYRAMAHFVIAGELADGPSKTTEVSRGCALLKDNEGKLDTTSVRSRVRFFLYGDKVQDLPPTC